MSQGWHADLNVAAMIVGPGESLRYLDRTLRLATAWADEIIAVADYCDEDTRDALSRYARIEPNPGVTFREDESAVRNVLMDALDAYLSAYEGEHIVVVLDADEQLGGRHQLELLEGCRRDDAHDAWPLTFYHVWDPTGRLYRVDGAWPPSPSYRIFRWRAGMRVAQRNLACAAIPEGYAARVPDSIGRVLHWGYARPHDRVTKHDRYAELDGGRFHSPSHLASILDPDPDLVHF